MPRAARALAARPLPAAHSLVVGLAYASVAALAGLAALVTVSFAACTATRAELQLRESLVSFMPRDLVRGIPSPLACGETSVAVAGVADAP